MQMQIFIYEIDKVKDKGRNRLTMNQVLASEPMYSGSRSGFISNMDKAIIMWSKCRALDVDIFERMLANTTCKPTLDFFKTRIITYNSRDKNSKFVETGM